MYTYIQVLVINICQVIGERTLCSFTRFGLFSKCSIGNTIHHYTYLPSVLIYMYINNNNNYLLERIYASRRPDQCRMRNLINAFVHNNILHCEYIAYIAAIMYRLIGGDYYNDSNDNNNDSIRDTSGDWML